jgi:uncharacterized protein
VPPTLAALKRRHPAHRDSADYWKILDALTQGGSKFTPELKQQLLSNPDNRPVAIQKERVKLARYFNKIGTISSRFISQLFAAPIGFEGSSDKFWKDTFFPGGALLPAEDDDGRSTFNAFLRAALLQALSQGKAIAQIDTSVATETLNKKQQRDRKEDEPYCLLVPRGDLWDWESDRGGFKFAKLHRFSWARNSWDGDPVAVHDFTIYQRKPDNSIVVSRYAVEHEDKASDFDRGTQSFNLESISESDAVIETVNKLDEKPIFHIGSTFKFPIVTLALPSSLWLADQLHDPQVSHFNQTASLEYGLVASNYAMPTIESDDIEDFTDRNKKFGDGYYIHLDPSHKEAIGWTDIDRTVQQIALSAADAVTSTSGQAIREARKPEEILLTTYGAMVKEFAKSILDVSAIGHNENVNWVVSGLDDFSSIDLTEVAQENQLVIQAGIQSQTFNKEVQKTFVREVGKQKEFDPKLLKKMLDEVDKAAPPPANPGEQGAIAEDAPPATDPQQDDSSVVDSVLNDPKLMKQLGIS